MNDSHVYNMLISVTDSHVYNVLISVNDSHVYNMLISVNDSHVYNVLISVNDSHGYNVLISVNGSHVYNMLISVNDSHGYNVLISVNDSHVYNMLISVTDSHVYNVLISVNDSHVYNMLISVNDSHVYNMLIYVNDSHVYNVLIYVNDSHVYNMWHCYFIPELSALRACLRRGVQHVYIVRQGLVADVFELYKDKELANNVLTVEFLGELGVDADGLTRELLASFWRQVAEDLFRGEDCIIPDLPLFRVRKESWKFECLGRILSHTVALTGRIPSFFAKSTLIRFTADVDVDDECLMDDFLLFVTSRERALLTKAMCDFSGLTVAEADRLQNFYMAHGFNNIPKAPEVRDQILAIAHQDLVEKPGSLVSKMRQGIPEDHRVAFWQRLSADDIAHIIEAQRPTPEKVADVIMSLVEDMTDDQDRTLYFLKEFVAGLDFDTLTDFLIFVTGSVHQPDKISVTFTTLTGLDRRPISHTCFNQLEVPTTYGSIKEFKREFLSVLASPEAFKYSEI